MSLLTTLAYAITAAVRPMVRDAEVAALKTQVDDLRREFNEALPRVERQRDDWQALAMEYRDALFQRPAPAQQQISRETQTLQAYAMMRPANAQLNQQLGTQNFGQALEDYVRNCTPARHELLTRG
jgi:hypothetical protein